MKSQLSALLTFNLLTTIAPAAQVTLEMLKAELQPKAAEFERIEIGECKEPFAFDVKLGDEEIKIAGDDFDGFRFTCPEIPEGSDLVWYFNTPKSWGQWYLTAVEGDPTRSFTNWLNADMIYQTYDKPGETDRFRVLQTLDGSFFSPGKEYVMWFSRNGGDEAGDLRGVLGFAKNPDEESDWDHDGVEKALGLKPHAPAEQVAVLDSRGGRAMLDEDLFDPSDAASRIEAVFWAKRRLVRSRGGFFITMSTVTPPCRKSPPIEAVIAKFGPPDFIRSAAENEKRMRNDEASDDDNSVTYYYDYFGFVVDPTREDKLVESVEAQATNYSALRSSAEGKSFGEIELEELKVFYDKGQEVGRIYGFGGGEETLTIQEPPLGRYEITGHALTNRGKGEWIEEFQYPDGSLKSRLGYQDNLRNGKAEGFYPDGKLNYFLNYKDGQLHGEAVRYDEEGAEVERQNWNQGEPE